MKKKKHKEHDFDVVIIGSGIVGLSSALYAARFKLKALVIGNLHGGTLNYTDRIENYPGFHEVTGVELATKVKSHAEKFGVKIIEEEVVSVEKCQDQNFASDGCSACFKVFTKEQHFHTKSIIFTTGTKWRELQVPGEKRLKGRGVHTCALCDGYAYTNKIVAVVGGSDSAAKEALLLSEYASKVYIIYRGEKLRPEPITLEKVLSNEKIEVIYHTNVVAINGSEKVRLVVLDRPYKGKTMLNVDAVFVHIGHVPLSQLAVRLGVNVNAKGEIVTNNMGTTNIDGVFAAGDVAQSEFKQAITGVAQGVMAAYSAYKYVTENNIICLLDDEDYEDYE
ncbi:MAG: FAD-dependent oxidoreductase [Candidatus Woesearchaeota archaeon]